MNNNSHIFKVLRGSLSEPRMRLYLQRANNDEALAIELYLYNNRLAQSCLFPLEITEVTVRNAMDRVLVARYPGSDWHQNPSFVDGELNPRSRVNLQAAIGRTRLARPDRDRIISTLTFDFWSNLFRGEYWAFWGQDVYKVFPNLEKSRHLEADLEYIKFLVKEINDFRNRVAHHEPILHMDVNLYHKKMEDITGMICKETATWMHAESTVYEMLRARPKPK